MRVPLVPGLRGSSAHRLLPMDLASYRDLPSGLPHSSILANVGARSTRTLDAVDVDTLADVAKLCRHPGYSLLRLVVVGDDVLEGRTSDENQFTIPGSTTISVTIHLSLEKYYRTLLYMLKYL